MSSLPTLELQIFYITTLLIVFFIIKIKLKSRFNFHFKHVVHFTLHSIFISMFIKTLSYKMHLKFLKIAIILISLKRRRLLVVVWAKFEPKILVFFSLLSSSSFLVCFLICSHSIFIIFLT